MKKQYYYQDKKVILHGFFQESQIIAPSVSMGGHDGGVLQYPVVVVEFDDGTICKIHDFNNLISKEIDNLPSQEFIKTLVKEKVE